VAEIFGLLAHLSFCIRADEALAIFLSGATATAEAPQRR
jgi:hypothetical protein